VRRRAANTNDFLNYGTFSFGSGSADVYNPAQYYASTSTNGLFTVGSGITGRKVLTEGVTPNPTKMDSEDISATLVQYGTRVIAVSKSALISLGA
jgi:hypothetical protein